jgi:O-antigen ligase
MINFKNLDFRSYAVISLLVLWISTTFSIALMEISFVCALVFWVMWRINASLTPEVKSGGRQIKPRGLLRVDWALWIPLALFFAAVLVSWIFSEFPKQSFRGFFKVLKPILVFIMAADLFRDSRSMKRFGGIFLATFLLVTIDCSIQYAFGKDLLRGFAAEHSTAGIRLVGPFGNFAKLATYLVLVTPVFLGRFLGDLRAPGSHKKSLYALGLALSGLLLLYLTRCRGPVVALVASLGILALYKRWFKVLGLGLIVFLAVIAMSPRHVIIHQDAEGKEQSIVERFELWKRALHVIEAKPLTGTGINTYNVAHEKYDKTQNWRVRGYYAHNGYLQLAAEIGIPGVIFFLVFIAMYFRRVLAGIRDVRGSPEEYTRLGFLAGILAFLIYAAFDNNLQSPPSLMFFWFSLGALLARVRQGA